MNCIQIAVLALVQGFAELLPISSSAHVVVAEKLMGLDPTLPRMTLLLVLLHTGTMLSVLVYFWSGWKSNYFKTKTKTFSFLKQVIIATAGTGFVGILFLELLKKIFHVEVEDLFGNLPLIAVSLAVAGLLILFAASREKKSNGNLLENRSSFLIGLLQGLCLPFRGFSRSGATISAGLLLGLSRLTAEEFSFALAVVITPPVIAKELFRLYKSAGLAGLSLTILAPDFLGMVLSFFAGLLALKWLSGWLAQGRWGWFGIYCLAASAAVASLHFAGW
ncbi:MAG: undecaprenyl-diphosphate phosphatase [bacterium]